MKRSHIGVVRARLTAWYVVATAAFLIVFGAVTYALLLHVLQRRMDASLVETAKSFEHALRVEAASGARPLADIIAEEVRELPYPDRPLAVFRENGQPVAGSRAVPLARRGFLTFNPGTDNAVRMLATPIVISGETFIVVVALRLDEQSEFLEAVQTALLVGIPLWVGCAGALGYWLVRKTLRPVIEMSEQQRRFMADASHELRTPIAIVRGEAEVALSKRERGADELRESLVVIENESRLLSSVIEDLFLLARADAGQAVLSMSAFYLDEVIAEVVRSQRSLAAKKSIDLVTQLAPESEIDADERLVRRLLMNLVDNAVKYTPSGGRVAVTLTQHDDAYMIAIADSATAISETTRARIFERFYQGDPNASEGAGLGLPIAQSIAELHGGRIDVTAGEEGTGNVFRVTLKRSAAGAHYSKWR